ncbi:substrate-binding domain-containing protein [Nocardia brevicatena]|uniref:substrate-binding domain-containing protein n=1 Tax=Nocardia brevicatena TaxID=37327 RepID=UPI00059412E7|nr:substrate-binding domain-containing protein [Nocardia brevicatena]
MGDAVNIVLAIIGIAVPVGAFLWEFVFVGRKQLGWRVQMDTPVTGEIESVYPGVLPQLRPTGDGSGPPLRDLSVVLIRIENNGATSIDAEDYAGPSNARVGLHLRFPQRRVIGMAVTELSDPGLGDCLDPASGIGVREDTDTRTGMIDLPKVPLNRADHYKILAILQRSAGSGIYPDPQLHGLIKGGRIVLTQSRSRVSLLMMALVAFLVLVIGAQFVVAAVEPDRLPLGCATGELTVIGSTAFAPVIRDAADRYATTCPGARFEFDFEGSELGMNRLEDEGAEHPGLLVIGDAPKGGDYPTLVQRPLALSLFAMVVHPSTGVRDLTVEQIRDLFLGRVDNWNRLGGADLPVRVINRYAGSGTRYTFEARLLDAQQPPTPDITCRDLRRGTGPGRCQVAVSENVLTEVAATPGAIGYSEFGTASATSGVVTVTIGGHRADRATVTDRAYPFWGVEYAFGHGDFPAGSLGAGFLRFLTHDTGQDVVRAHGNTPCAELADPSLCSPRR